MKAGFSEFESKYIVGKKIPLSDATYLSLEEGIKEKYKEKYDKFLNIKPTAQNGLAKDKAIRQLEHENKEHKETIDALQTRIDQLQNNLNKVNLNIDILMEDYKARAKPQQQEKVKFT